MAKATRTTLTLEDAKILLTDIFDQFVDASKREDVRTKVLKLIPAIDLLRKLGKQIIPNGSSLSARDRILDYLKRYPTTIIDSKELLVVSGITDYQRRIRELRVQFGWKIISGKTAVQLSESEEWDNDLLDISKMKADQYILLDVNQDREAAFRWNVLNTIRKERTSVQDKILSYLRANVGAVVTGEELAYLANGKKEWARRTRELRTQEGWPVKTRVSGRPDLPVGVYVLEEDRQAEVHDRKILDPVRVEVLVRDGYSCRKCGWKVDQRSAGDPRHLLELHHLDHHVLGGENTTNNLVTVCNVHHDEIHRHNLDRTAVLAYLGITSL